MHLGPTEKAMRGPLQCFECGGDHLARDCPLQNLQTKGNGKGRKGTSVRFSKHTDKKHRIQKALHLQSELTAMKSVMDLHNCHNSFWNTLESLLMRRSIPTGRMCKSLKDYIYTHIYIYIFEINIPAAAPKMRGTNFVECFTCGGAHLARECPERGGAF